MALAIDRSEKALIFCSTFRVRVSEKREGIRMSLALEHLTKTKLENRKAQNELMSFALTSLSIGDTACYLRFATGMNCGMFTSDRVLMDGVNVRSSSCRSLRSAAGMVWRKLPEETLALMKRLYKSMARVCC